MKNNLRMLLMITIVCVSACSTDSAKRVAYETLQNIKEQECLRNNSSDCPKRESYDDYQRQRNALDMPNK